MVGGGRKWLLVAVTVASFGLLLAVTLSSAERIFLDGDNASSYSERSLEKVWNFLWRSNESEYHHVWPAMKFGWGIVIGTIVGFFGAAVGSVGGVGGGGIFVPMLTLIIGFDAETSSADSKQGSSHTTSSERGNWIMRILELRLFWKDRRKSYSMASMEPCDLQKKRSRNRDLLGEIWNHPPGSIPFSFHSLYERGI